MFNFVAFYISVAVIFFLGLMFLVGSVMNGYSVKNRMRFMAGVVFWSFLWPMAIGRFILASAITWSSWVFIPNFLVDWLYLTPQERRFLREIENQINEVSHVKKTK